MGTALGSIATTELAINGLLSVARGGTGGRNGPYHHLGVYYATGEALAGRPASAVGAAAVAYKAPLTISELRRRKEQETKLAES